MRNNARTGSACPLFALLLLLLALTAYGQQQERVAIIQTVDNRDSIGISDLAYLTDRLREVAVNVLPESHYYVMTTESIVAFLGSQEDAMKICKEASCLADLGRKVNADYVAQARIGRFNKNLTIKTELYSSKKGNLINSFTGESKNLFGLLAIINEKAPILLKKLDKRLYSVKLNTEPTGADLSFDGDSQSSCVTPCKVELPAGSIRITADLDEYETADTTISIKQNNQSVNIKLKPNFGILEIKPAYLNSIGKDGQWSLTLNGQSFYSLENKLPPANYKGELSHECYEDISFNIGVSKGKRQIFDMAKRVKLRKNGSCTPNAEIEIGMTNTGYFADSRDGKKYKMVKIGTQTWMAENLNYNASSSKCYDNNPAYCQKYGRLYNWNTAMKACPKGWHLPTKAEWDILTTEVGGWKTEGYYLKSVSGWDYDYPGKGKNATDAYGFSALPGGSGPLHELYDFVSAGLDGHWWSASKDERWMNTFMDAALWLEWALIEKNNDKSIQKSELNKLLSVRCLKD